MAVSLTLFHFSRATQRTVHRTSGKLGKSGSVLVRNKLSKLDLLPEFHRQDPQLRSENETPKIAPI
jgi:hypothetical protein